MELQQRNAASCLERRPRSLDEGRASLNLAGAQACLAQLNNRTCAQGLPFSGCSTLLTGLVPRDGACFDSNECDATSWCDLSTACPGRCVARVAVGQLATPETGCVENAYVFNGVCTALVPMGQSCAPPAGSTVTRACLAGQCINNVCGPRALDLTEGATCAPNTSPECARGLQCSANRCIPLVDLNGACDSARRCKGDLYCSPANVCVRPGPAGAACSPDLQCAAGLYCNRPAGSTSGTCAPFKQVDAPCTAQFECDPNTMYCTATTAQPNGVCRLKGAVMAACTFPNRFWSCGEYLYCTATSATPNGVCANQKSAGATCDVNGNECLGRCMSGRCTVPQPCLDLTP